MNREPNTVAIREAVRADIGRLITIEAQFPGDRLERRHFLHAVRSPSIVALVAELDGQAAGYALLETRRRSATGRISSIAVAPETSGKGVGRCLLSAVEEESLRRGRDAVRLEVRADNDRAIALYDGCGYRRTGRTEAYYDDGCAAVRFEKALADG